MTKQKKLLKKELTNIVNSLKTKYRPEKIILFGSMAWGKPTKDSDLDLLIIKSGVDKTHFHDRSYQVSGLISHDVPVDILVYSPYDIQKRIYLGDPFFKSILNKGRVVYGA